MLMLPSRTFAEDTSPSYQIVWFLVGLLWTMTMTMTHSEKSHIHRMKAWPYRQECRDHGPRKKESVLLVELARWQGAQVQTVKRQNVVKRYLK